jgi:hypothetical protein
MLGKVPHPESGKSELDLDGASLFIDTLEMLQGKTRGNLGKHEEAMLKQSLTMLRMAYVEKVNAAPNVDTDATKPVSAAPPPAPSATDSSDAESKKKFTKKY